MKIKSSLKLFTVAALISTPVANAQTSLGGVNLGHLTDYLFVFTNGSSDANWQGATKGFAGDVAVNGLVASERTSGSVPFAGTIYTNDTTLGAWQGIVDQNKSPSIATTQAFGSTGQTARLAGLQNDLSNAFTQINGLTATGTITNAGAWGGYNSQNGIAETLVFDMTGGLTFSNSINIFGDASDTFVFRWDDDGNLGNGYNGQVKLSGGGGFVPKGGLTAGNFINVAGDINSSGGGSPPASPYPQGPRLNNGQGALITNGSDFSSGGFFTGYWLTTGDPTKNFESSSLSNANFVGGWYSSNSKFSMTSGTSGVYVAPNPMAVPEPGSLMLTVLGAFGLLLRRKRSNHAAL